MTVWVDDGKKKLRKHFLTMFLREAHFLYSVKLIHLKMEKNIISYSKFCKLCPVNVLLLDDTPIELCKCLIHENVLMKLDALGYYYQSKFWNEVLCNTSPNSNCWLSSCDNCRDCKKLIPTELNKIVNKYKQWQTVTVHPKDNNLVDKGKYIHHYYFIFHLQFLF